jgi:hypothetical protein
MWLGSDVWFCIPCPLNYSSSCVCFVSWEIERDFIHLAALYEFCNFFLCLKSFPYSTKKTYSYIRGPLEKFVDSPYYSESELCGGAVTVSFSKQHLPWQAMHFSKTGCRPFITSKILASEIPFRVEKPRNRMGARSGPYGGCSNGVPPIQFFQAENKLQFRSRPMRFLGFSNHDKGDLR